MINSRKGGFTLFEIMMGVAIIGVLMGFVMPQINKQMRQLKVRRCSMIMGAIKQALVGYELDNGKVPQKADGGIQALLKGGKYLENEKEIQDPWGNDIVYNAPPVRFKNKYKKYELYSLGASGEEDENNIDDGQ